MARLRLALLLQVGTALNSSTQLPTVLSFPFFILMDIRLTILQYWHELVMRSWKHFLSATDGHHILLKEATSTVCTKQWLQQLSIVSRKSRNFRSRLGIRGRLSDL